MARKTPWQQALSQFVLERRAHPGGRRGLSPEPRTLGPRTLGPRTLGPRTLEPRTLGPGALAKGAFPLLAIALAIALVAALAAGLLVLRPGGMAQAQDGETGETIETIEYAENGTDPVARFTATDPEGAMPITWSLATTAQVSAEADLADADNADAEHFDISQDGVLTFDIGGDRDAPDNSAAPDFEAPRGIAFNAATNTNTYRVVVAAADAADGGQTSYRKVAVMVTDVEEKGEVAWSVDPDGGGTHRAGTPKLIQFQVGASLKASVTDGDIIGTEKTVDADRADVAADPTWRWYRSPDRTSTGTMIAGANSDTYSVTAADAGMYLRAVAYYVVTRNVTQETASLTSAHPVLAARTGDHRLTFSPAAVSREVAEGGKGMNAGAPVTATGNHGAVNYTLVDVGDYRKFKIDQETGQITTAVDLDYDAAEADRPANCRDANFCTVTVRATDASGDSTGRSAPTIDATVTIRVTDVDERPEFTETAGTAMSPEAIRSPEGRTALFGDETGPGFSDMADDVTYAATDPEGLNVNLTLLGPDGDRFRLSASQVLSFREKPDYEMPADADRDNVYLVTVRASDGALHNDRVVAVTVQNVDEAPVIMRGGLSISGAQSTDFAENGTGAVAMFTARGPMKDMASWTLEGADAMYFSLGTAMGAMTELRFRSAPDYEMPRGMARSDANTNTYTLTLKAGDGAYMAARDVTVMVANVDEDGMVTLPAMPPVVGVALTAALSDPDGSAAEAWQWARSRDMGSWTDIAGATMASYTPEDADAGHYLRAAVTYTDNHGPGAKTLTAVTAARVAADADALLVARYDTNPRNGMIDKAEVIAAINDYLFPRAGTEPITRAQVIVLINRYLGSG